MLTGKLPTGFKQYKSARHGEVESFKLVIDFYVQFCIASGKDFIRQSIGL